MTIIYLIADESIGHLGKRENTKSEDKEGHTKTQSLPHTYNQQLLSRIIIMNSIYS